MEVCVIAAQKGGVGKTTLAAHLSVEAEAQGHGPVALVDLDPQGSLSGWWNKRVAETPLYATPSLDNLREHLDQLAAAGIKLVIIDTPPAIVEAIKTAVAVADFVLIPSRPSPLDLEAIGPTIEIVEDAGKPLAFVVNSAIAKARLTLQTGMALAEHGKVAPSVVHNRVDFASAMIDGRTVSELDAKGKSAAEIRELYSYVSKQIGKTVTTRKRKGA